MHFVLLLLSPSRSPGGNCEDGHDGEDAILTVIFSENKKEPLHPFPVLFSLCEGTSGNWCCHCSWLCSCHRCWLFNERLPKWLALFMEHELEMELSGLTHWWLTGGSLQGTHSPKRLVQNHQLGPSRWDLCLCASAAKAADSQGWTLGQEKAPESWG